MNGEGRWDSGCQGVVDEQEASRPGVAVLLDAGVEILTVWLFMGEGFVAAVAITSIIRFVNLRIAVHGL